MKKELLIYLVILIFSSLIMHSDLLYDPFSRLEIMSERGNYYHPFLFALIIYLIVGLVRLIVNGIRKLIKR